MRNSLEIPFEDVPEIKQVKQLLEDWRRPEPPERMKRFIPATGDFLGLCRSQKKKLADTVNPRSRRQLELLVIDWLYGFISSNVKRGREFDLSRVLADRTADCLGYSKLFTLLGRRCGLDTGIVDIIRDNAGRLVPHTAIMARLADGQRRFIDFWYGSKDIRHKRLGLQVKRDGKWQVEDMDFKELKKLDACYLPDSYIDGITGYIIGNKHLKNGEFEPAVKSYLKALELYPGNPRFLYNRAIAFVKLDETEKAKADYAQALRSEDAAMRVLATEHEEVTALMGLDSGVINSKAQEIYLLHKGFTTGRKVSVPGIARRFRLSETEARAIIYAVEEQLRKNQS